MPARLSIVVLRPTAVKSGRHGLFFEFVVYE